MRTLNRNKSPFWYLLYDSKAPAKDEYDNETGEELVVYKPAVAMNANISAATGSAQVEQFGNFAGYDKVIVTDDLSCPIDENSLQTFRGHSEDTEHRQYRTQHNTTLTDDRRG